MIPKFPQFKKLELKDEKDVEKFNSQYQPYSDFNFISMWSWNIEDKIYISILNDNLVVRFLDYVTNKIFYSFLGNNNTNDTVKKLLELSKKEGLSVELKLIPEDSIKGLDFSKFKIIEDRDNFDYIYKVENLKDMSGGKFEVKRKRLRFFKKNFEHEIKILKLNNFNIKNEIINLFNDWAFNKGKTISYFQNEFSALIRLLNCSNSVNFFVIGIYFKNKLIAISITGHTHSLYNIGHFQKTHAPLFKGLNDYLVNTLAHLLFNENIQYMNCEQDLGITGLRINKESYAPYKYLKKFIVSFQEK